MEHSIWRYLKAYRTDCVLGPLCKLIEATLELFVPVVMASIIDQGVRMSDTPYVLRMCGVLVLLGAAGLGFSVAGQFFSARAAVGFSGKLRSALFAHVQSFSYAAMDAQGAPTLITRMTSDINQVQSGLNMALRLFLRSPFVVLGSVLAAFLIDVRSAVVFAVVVPLISLVIAGVLWWTMPRYKNVQAALDKVLGLTRENLTGVRVIRAFGQEDAQVEQFAVRNEDLTNRQLRVGAVSALMNPGTYVLLNLAAVVLIQQGAWRVDGGAITQGQLVALLGYMTQISVELIKLANTIILSSKALACAARVESVLKVDGAMPAPAAPQAAPARPDVPAVEFRKVSITYPGGGDDALSDVTFIARAGETVGIIGGTGSGKSTLVNLIPRFYDVTGGEVLVNGVDVRRQDPETLRAGIGIVPQKALLFKGTIRDNLHWGNPEADDAQLWAALESAQAAEVVRGKPGELDAPVEQSGRNLSGGQRQRLTIARALVRRPGILILDDSASALDYATDAALRGALRRLDWNPAVFIVSQRAASVMHADRILVLEDGRVADMGTHEELLARCDVYREIYESQFEPSRKGGEGA